jgi:hypothetical protein
LTQRFLLFLEFNLTYSDRRKRGLFNGVFFKFDVTITSWWKNY